jgi:chromatin modification-related protein YNG2
MASRSSARPLAATPTLENLGAIGRNPALAISESLRNAFAMTSTVDSPSVSPALSSGPATKSKSHLFPSLE